MDHLILITMDALKEKDGSLKINDIRNARHFSFCGVSSELLYNMTGSSPGRRSGNKHNHKMHLESTKEIWSEDFLSLGKIFKNASKIRVRVRAKMHINIDPLTLCGHAVDNHTIC